MSFIETVELQNINELDGVLYREIKHLLDDKIQLENLLFTTRIMFLDNEELVEFMNKLIEYGYEDIALDYVEHIYDKIVLDFSKLKTFNENKNKQ